MSVQNFVPISLVDVEIFYRISESLNPPIALDEKSLKSIGLIMGTVL